MLGFEPFFMELIGGIEESLAAEGRSLLLHVVPDHDAEIRTYRRWGEGNLVDAVVVVNIALEDARLDVLGEIGIPTVVVGGPRPDLPFANVWIDNARGHADRGHPPRRPRPPAPRPRQRPPPPRAHAGPHRRVHG